METSTGRLRTVSKTQRWVPFPNVREWQTGCQLPVRTPRQPNVGLARSVRNFTRPRNVYVAGMDAPPNAGTGTALLRDTSTTAPGRTCSNRLAWPPKNWVPWTGSLRGPLLDQPGLIDGLRRQHIAPPGISANPAQGRALTIQSAQSPQRECVTRARATLATASAQPTQMFGWCESGPWPAPSSVPFT